MKQLIITIFLASSPFLLAQKMTLELSVSGNCHHCKQRIEKAAKIKGVSVCNWNMNTEKLLLEFNTKKTNLTEIKQAILEVGHDVEDLKATDEIYNSLPDCCLHRGNKKSCH